MDDAAFQQLLDRAKKKNVAPQAPAPEAAPAPAPEGGGVIAPPQALLDRLGVDPEQAAEMQQGAEEMLGASDRLGLQAPDRAAEAFALGGVKAGLEVKDAIVGEPKKQTVESLITGKAEDTRSGARKAVEGRLEDLKGQSMVNGFAAGIGQFATGMLALGGMGSGVVKALPWVRTGVAALPGAATTLEVGKAAVVGAMAFDPWEERLSNLIQDTPLANPLNGWLAADPEDAAWEGRAKAALESVGLDAILIGTFMAAGKAYKWYKRGDPVRAAAEAKALQDSIEQARVANEAEFGMDFGAVAPAAPTEAVSAAIPDAAGAARAAAQDAPTPAPKPAVDSRPVDTQLEPEAVDVEIVKDATVPRAETIDPMAPPNAAKPRVQLSDENTDELYTKMVEDTDAFETHGSWTGTVDSGYAFGRGERIPYQKLAVDGNGELNNFMARLTDAAEESLFKAGVDKVVSDARVERMVRYRADLLDERPEQLMAMIQKAGAGAQRMVADMEVGYLVSQRMFMDTFALANKIRLGDYLGYGTKELALAELKKQASVAASVYAASKQMSSGAGRAMRRMRGDFKIDPEAAAKLTAIDGDALVQLVIETGGDPKKVKQVLQPGLLEKVTDGVNFLLINNLVSGFPTQVVNAATNAYMVGARPMERIIGSALLAPLGKADLTVFKRSAAEYLFMGTALRSGFKSAVKAFVKNDSILSPHTTEVYGVNGRMGQPRFKPLDGNPLNAMHNTFQLGMAAVGAPTRVLGGTDELVKQVVYRSRVMADAHVAAMEEGVRAGYKGKALKAFVGARVKQAVDGAFDDMGRAVNPKALEEAHVATFQQALLTSATNPGGKNTFGSTMQMNVGRHPGLRFILPFVRTPANVLRYGWKMTPGLNLVQREYRAMFLGQMGAEKQAQAVGQMAMGTMFMSSAMFAVNELGITGAGPADPKRRAALTATGWRPYSIPVENDDGTTTWYSYGRYDPVAVPIGIIADIADMVNIEGEDAQGVDEAATALALALAKQFTNKSYMSSLDQALDALMDESPKGERMKRFAGTTIGNLVPYSAMLRNEFSDEHLKEARTVVDRIMAGVPGIGEGVPDKYDMWGDPILARRGLWSTDSGEAVDYEIQRMITEAGVSPSPPNPRVGGGVDLRDVTMADGTNAFETYSKLTKDLGGRTIPMKELAEKLMRTRAYMELPDGDAATKGTRLWLLEDRVIRPYRDRALKLLKQDPEVRKALGERQEKAFEKIIEGRRQSALRSTTTQASMQVLVDDLVAT